MGFCRRCGDIVSGPRCKCGGQSVAPVIAKSFSDSRYDAWSKIYVKPEPARSPSRPPSKILPKPERGILSSPFSQDGTLSKVYGSILQPEETWENYCAQCNTVFAPDATIYPDPNTEPTDSPRFLCRTCFTIGGGSKGNCPSCSRPVLILRSEGGFVHASGKYWHKRCFKCIGCSKDIGGNPMVDLHGDPCCENCFGASPRRGQHIEVTPSKGSLGGTNRSTRSKSREGSPAMDELEKRLGITPTKNSPVFSSHDFANDTPTRSRTQSRPLSLASDSRREDDQHPLPGLSEIEKTGLGSRHTTTHFVAAGDPVFSRTDYGDSRRSDNVFLEKTNRSSPEPASFHIASELPSPDKCAKCNIALTGAMEKGGIIWTSSKHPGGKKAAYHATCLRCVVCSRPFLQTARPQNAFCESENGPCHVQCMPTNSSPSTPRKSSSATRISGPTGLPSPATPPSSSRYSKPTSPPALKTLPRFGSSTRCPGCEIVVSPMERGVVPGPQGTRWHATCLVCGGKGTGKSTRTRPGCGKSLDSSAKTDVQGRIWCRECLLMLSSELRNPSPQASPVQPNFTGGTTLVQQFTGLSRNFTGGSARSVSPTKQLGITRARPKSVIEMRIR